MVLENDKKNEEALTRDKIGEIVSGKLPDSEVIVSKAQEEEKKVSNQEFALLSKRSLENSNPAFNTRKLQTFKQKARGP